ncbi:hypothetical protein ASPVEDRAFT_56607 [Aspergillus versicolor CBS 583.65]|uniref:Uncharacterized protein n=1 Tax=Aspergillus versicolor CBS 583.65 TaxID=1036611 RepID=A0A1L9Q033_ASPVE|nr:uncharacterized protein ASPVEDRAFT_56607 [Aspergillus versicolor CBS 583.65]OJJ07130.1 hypothetical protein ASPVEDRAFT_56607 [Aspergillus versicolor CBS 583.65]
MSRTETTNTTTLSVLADYELHHSGSEPSPNTSQNTTSPSPTQQQPANWPTNHRRVPPYRPANRSLSFEERAAGSNLPEFIFIQSMLHGCWLNASVARLWRFTGGRINDRIFHYEIGGEY